MLTKDELEKTTMARLDVLNLLSQALTVHKLTRGLCLDSLAFHGFEK